MQQGPKDGCGYLQNKGRRCNFPDRATALPFPGPDASNVSGFLSLWITCKNYLRWVIDICILLRMFVR